MMPKRLAGPAAFAVESGYEILKFNLSPFSDTKMAETDNPDVSSESERRGADRKKLIINVRFEGGDGTGIANTRDIGLGGLYMTTTAQLAQGTPIVMTLSLGPRTMNIDGVIAYSDEGHGVGVRFRNLDPSDEAFLKQELEIS